MSAVFFEPDWNALQLSFVVNKKWLVCNIFVLRVAPSGCEVFVVYRHRYTRIKAGSMRCSETMYFDDCFSDICWFNSGLVPDCMHIVL
jgi:hypothetical protein